MAYIMYANIATVTSALQHQVGGRGRLHQLHDIFPTLVCTTSFLPCRDNVPRLQDFSQRFTSRFCELMHDVEEEVGAAGLHLLALLVEHGVVKHQVMRLECLLSCIRDEASCTVFMNICNGTMLVVGGNGLHLLASLVERGVVKHQVISWEAVMY
jgi:hypothetical protein